MESNIFLSPGYLILFIASIKISTFQLMMEEMTSTKITQTF